MRALVGGVLAVGGTLLDPALDAGNTATRRWGFAAAFVAFTLAAARLMPADAWVVAGRWRARGRGEDEPASA